MARFCAAQMLALLAVAALAARGASAAVPIPSILATSDGGAITFTDLSNVTAVSGIDVLSGDFTFTAELLGSYADSKFAYTLALTEPGNKFRLFITDLATFSKSKVLGSLLLNVKFNPSCLSPVAKLMSVTKSGSNYKIHVATHCRVVAAKKCAKTTGQTAADVITVYQFNYAALPGKFGTLTTTAKGVVPVPECTRAILHSTQAVKGSVLLLASLYGTTRNQAKRIGQLAAFQVRGVQGAPAKLTFAQTFTVKFAGLYLTTGVAGSTTSIFAVARKGAAGQEKIYSWAKGRAAYIGGLAGQAKVRSYDSIVSVGSDVYTAISDLNVPVDEPTPGRIVLTTDAQLKAGAGGTTITTDIVSYGEITYVGEA